MELYFFPGKPKDRPPLARRGVLAEPQIGARERKHHVFIKMSEEILNTKEIFLRNQKKLFLKIQVQYANGVYRYLQGFNQKKIFWGCDKGCESKLYAKKTLKKWRREP